MAKIKFAITPGFEVGGTLFKPEQLALLGSIVGQEARIELTSFKQLYIEMEEERIDDVQQQLRNIGLEVHPAGFFTKSLIACQFCKGAEEAGLDIARQLDKAIVGHEVPNPLKIGYAGCALGTSEPLLKDIGVIRMNDTYDIYVGGDGKSLKAKLGVLFLSGISEQQLIPIVSKLIALYQQSGKKREKFAKFLDRMTLEIVKETITI